MLNLEIKERVENGAQLVPKSICEEHPEGLPEMSNGIPLKDIPLIDDSKEDLTTIGGNNFLYKHTLNTTLNYYYIIIHVFISIFLFFK